MTKKKKLILLYNCFNQLIFQPQEEPFNLGLLAISATLKQAGFQVKLLPNISRPKTIPLLKKLLPQTILVGVSCITGDPIINGLLLSKTIKKMSPKTPVVWGGYQATLDSENTAKEKDIDHIVRSQGERIIVKLAQDIQKGKKNIPRILASEAIEPISNFPPFDYDLYYETYPTKKVKNIIYNSSRGCPFECTFCSVTHFYNRRYLQYDTQRLISDLTLIIEKYHPERISLWDDNFFVDLNRVNEFTDWYIKTKQQFSWNSFSRCSTFANKNPVLMDKLQKTNCREINFGAESGSPRMLKYIKKHMKIKDVTDSCRQLTAYGITPDYSFMTGLPTETIPDLKKTIQLIHKILAINPKAITQLYRFCPKPGIPILQDCTKYGFVYPQRISQWSTYQYHSYIAPWITPKQQELIKIMIWIVYFAPEIPTYYSSWWLKIAFNFCHWDASTRIKHNFFNLSPEWLFIDFFYKRHFDKEQAKIIGSN